MKFSDLNTAESSRYLTEARLEINRHTADRLRVCKPDNEEDVDKVGCCIRAVAEALFEIAQAGTGSAGTALGFEVAGLVSSVSAGSESVSFKAVENAYTAAARDPKKRDALVYGIISRYLSGVTVGGVSVLYCGIAG